MLTNFPKIYSPFIRKTFKVNKADWEKHGRKLQMRTPEVYLVVDEINPGYEWVFESETVFATEKLDGTNIKLETKDGRLIALQNRKNIIDPLQIIKGKTFIPEGIFQSIGKGYVEKDGIQTGELIGPKVQGNPYELNIHQWYPFSKAIKHLRYNSFDEHDRTFDNWSSWFKYYLWSRFAGKYGCRVFAEGIIIYDLKRKAEHKTYMAKIRRDMFSFFYSDKIEIYNYKP